MTLFGGIDPSRRGSSESGASASAAASHEEQRRPARSTQLCVGTLACRRCDAPVALGARSLTLSDRLTCPFCDHHGPARDFLSLTTPTRPARVTVRVRLLAGSTEPQLSPGRTGPAAGLA